MKNLQDDFRKVTGRQAELLHSVRGPRLIVAGSLESRFVKELVKAKKIDITSLKGKREILDESCFRPFDGVDEAWVIVGSDKRGTIYGIYELSEQIGVSLGMIGRMCLWYNVRICIFSVANIRPVNQP